MLCWKLAATAAALGISLAALAEDPSSTLQEQAAAYAAQRTKAVLELQQFRSAAALRYAPQNGRSAEITLIDLNPAVNSWFLLKVDWGDRRGGDVYHLENPAPQSRNLILSPELPGGLVIAGAGADFPCPLWSQSPPAIAEARASGRPYAPLCEGRLYLRNPVKGHRSTEEFAVGLLREHVWQGESLINFVKTSFFQDAFLSTSETSAAGQSDLLAPHYGATAPPEPLINPASENGLLQQTGLGIELDGRNGPAALVGHWYAAKGMPGIYVSTFEPRLAADAVKDLVRPLIQPLDEVESKALVYLVAFSLESMQAGFAVGAEHPGVEWSERAVEEVVDRSLPGPDGIGALAPLVVNGLVSPAVHDRIAAVFTGGFKRHHGAFRYGELAHKNHGSHYGFVQEGAVLSKLQPDLATFVAYNDGRIDLRTWTDSDNRDLLHVRFARQNGVPIIDFDERSASSAPGSFVRRWGLGNWSGSQDSSQRTLRSGLCLQESAGARFLIYGYFSSVTPSAMAQVFQAYGCKYAMHLDMNALEHTYLALQRRDGEKLEVEHLISGMNELDMTEKGRVVPRFVGFADNRDFFYILRRSVQ